MTASDRIGAIALVVSLGLFLSITVNGRMETMNLAFDTLDDRLDGMEATVGRVDELYILLNRVPTDVRELPEFIERVRAAEAAAAQFEARMLRAEANHATLVGLINEARERLAELEAVP